MDHFLIESIFRLQTKNKLIVTGCIKSDLKLKNYIINVIVLNNSAIPINTVNETIIENQPYLALTINIDCISEELLSMIMKLKKGQIIQIK
ncbi:MAG: hypothetical protein LBE39_08140 [Flavobacteriaceae bacterium]|jgi:hypothetical protein|nr:hypothetical protein [Flavobacteriaceae bacterium]